MKPNKQMRTWLLSGLCMFFAYAASTQTASVTDENVTDKIEMELMWQTDIPGNQVDVTTRDGVVTLEGEVESILAKERSEKIASAMKGVEAIINRIEVNPPMKEDAALANDVEVALFNDPATDSYEITVEADEGVVTLNGQVESWQEKQLSGYVAKGVNGVRAVENDLDIHYPEQRADLEIKREINRAIENDIRLRPKLITTKVENGNVWLSGTVGSLNERRLAVSYAWTTGVESVNFDGLHIHDWAKKDLMERTPIVVKTDQEIRESVEKAFLYDPRVYSFNPTVRVNDRVVTLSGMVTNLKAKKAAADDARNVKGVAYVKNNLKVRPLRIPENEDLENRVETSLRLDADVNRFEIDVTAWKGKVYLNGTVDTYFEKYQAEDVASSVKGAVSVVNNLEVNTHEDYGYYYPYGWNSYFPTANIDPDSYYGNEMTDWQVKDNIKQELWWSPFVNASDVNVKVEQGVATLSGQVDSWREREYAVENAYEGGADTVVDLLVIGQDETN